MKFMVQSMRNGFLHISSASVEQKMSMVLNERHLEDGWLMYQLVSYYQESGNLPSQDLYMEPNKGNRKDIEDLCEHANLTRSLISPKWVHHQCTTKGCGEGFAVIDGNKKKLIEQYVLLPKPGYRYQRSIFT